MKIAKLAAAASTALLCALALGPAAATAATTHAWAQDGFDAGNTGFNPNETTINRTSIQGVNWRWGIVSPVNPQFCGFLIPRVSPVVAGGRLFFADQGGFAAYNAAAGNQLWSVRLGLSEDAEVAAMAVSGSTLLVSVAEGCHSASDPDGTLRAYDVATGALLWSVFREEPMYQLMTDQGVAVGLGGDAAANVATAYRVSDGHQLWAIVNVTADAPVSAGGRVLLTGDPGFQGNPTSTMAVNITTGAILWSKPVTWLAEAATPDGKRFLVRTLTNDLVEVFAAAGGVAWTIPGAAGPLAVDNLQVYVSQGGRLNVYSSGNGAFEWAGGSADPREKPIVAGGIVYVTEGGDLNTYDSTTGQGTNFGFGFQQGYIYHVVVENGRLYAMTGRILDAYTP